MRIAGLLFLIAGSALMGGALLRDFQGRLPPAYDPAHLPETAVVLTGQFDRIGLAMSLFDQGHVRRMFVSGVNPGAGMQVDRFAAQFQLSPRARTGLASGDITLATGATSTLENALETACWLQRQDGTEAVVLITSHLHMPRAALALERALEQTLGRGVAIIGVSPEPETAAVPLRQRLLEFAKFAATHAVTLLPARWWTRRAHWPCT